MARSRFSIVFALALGVILALPAAMGRIAERISEAIWFGLAYIVRAVARPPAFALPSMRSTAAFGGSMTTSFRTDQRHEAGTKRRASERHI